MVQIEVSHQAKLTTVWLTREEQENPAVKAQLDILYADCKCKKYTVVVFYSGGKDLRDQTSGLLCYNRRRAAQIAERGM